MAADVLLRLAALLDRPDYREKAEQVFTAIGGFVRQYASGFARMLAAADFYIGPTKEIAIAGKPDEFVRAVRQRYLPRVVIAGGTAGDVALLRDRPAIDGKPTAYVCENFVCKAPVTDLADFLSNIG